MSEFAPKSPEAQNNAPEVVHAPEKHEAHKEHEKSHEKSPAEKHEQLKHLRHEVERQAVSSKEGAKKEPRQTSHHGTSPLVNKELKDAMFNRTIARVQKHLNAPNRAFSKVVHNNVVDKASAVGEATVARPYGLLGGGIFALIGTVFATYLSKHFGIHYNLFIFVMFFVAGYVVTTVLELIFKLFRTAK